VSLKSQIQSDVDALLSLDEFASEITIGGVTVKAIVEQNDTTPELDADAHQARVYVAISSLPSRPTYRLPVVIDGETWSVFRDKQDRCYYLQGGMYIIPIYRNERPRVF
jgi:hypothetical protein